MTFDFTMKETDLRYPRVKAGETEINFELNPNPHRIFPDELDCVATAAVLSAEYELFCDSVFTGRTKRELSFHLAFTMQITDYYRATSDIDTLFELDVLELYPSILDLALEKESKVTIISNSLKVEAYGKKLRAAMPILISDGHIKDTSELKEIDASAYNLAEAAFLARICGEANFLDLNSMWTYLRKALNERRKHYKSWEQFAKGFMVGLAMAEGASERFKRDSELVRRLISGETGLWTELDF